MSYHAVLSESGDQVAFGDFSGSAAAGQVNG